jgi:putative addiction module CopG family antidote
MRPETEAEIRRLVESGLYPDAASVIESALQELNEQYEANLANLRELVRAGFESGDGGELTDEFWDEIAREADEADRLGLPIRREVRP